MGTREKEPGGGKTVFVGRIKRRPPRRCSGGVVGLVWYSSCVAPASRVRVRVRARVSEGLHRRGSRVASEAGEGIVPLHVAGGLLGLAWLLPPHRGAGPLG